MGKVKNGRNYAESSFVLPSVFVSFVGFQYVPFLGMRSPNSRSAKALVADTDVGRLLSAVVPGQELSYQEHRRVVECKEAIARWPLLSDLAESLASSLANSAPTLHS